MLSGRNGSKRKELLLPRNRRLSAASQDSNRLNVHDDGTSAHCELVGLLLITPPSFTSMTYEVALAMQLAIQHLNQGNGSLVEEVAGLGETCPITFSASFANTTMNPNNAFATVDLMTRFVAQEDDDPLPALLPTNSTTANAMAATASPDLVQAEESPASARGALPCAFVGALPSSISKTTGLVTGLRGFPQVSPASTSTDLSEKSEYPLFARTIPDDGFSAQALLKFLHDTLEIRHVFVVFESDPFPRSILKSLHDAIRELGWAPGYKDEEDGQEVFHVEQRIIDSRPTSGDWDLYDGEQTREAMKALKSSEYRFVIALTSSGETNDRLMQIAYDEDVAGRSDGTYQWFFVETLSSLGGRTFEKDSKLAKAYNGTGFIYQSIEQEGSLNARFVNQSRELYEGYYDAAVNTALAPGLPFVDQEEWFGNGAGYTESYAAYAYDATILLGLSACREVTGRSEDGSSPLFLTGNDFFRRIQETNFTGITGRVELDPNTGTRRGDTVKYAIDNLLGFDDDDNVTMVKYQSKTSYVHATGGQDDWENVSTYIFSGGKTLQELGPNPDLPPLEKIPIYVSKWTVGVALGLLVTILLATIASAICTCWFWNSRVVRASQPRFLLLLCFGIGIMALSILPATMEHTKVDNSTEGSIICYSFVYLLAIGFGITFSALFAKTYRINKILASSKKCRRVKISFQDMCYPVVIVFLFNIIILSLMTRFEAIKYVTDELNEDRFGRPQEEYGHCAYDSSRRFFFYILVAANIGVVCLAIFQAWRARNLSTEFAESKYIANALLVSFIVAILAIPVAGLIEMDPDLDTFVTTILVAVNSGVTLCSIFVPKMMFHRKAKNRRSDTTTAAFSMISASVRSEGSGHLGERILTTKPQEELLSENQVLKRKLHAMERKAERLDLKNAELQGRLKDLTGEGENNLSGDADDDDKLRSDTEFDLHNGASNVDSDDDDEENENVEVSEVNSDLSEKSDSNEEPTPTPRKSLLSRLGSSLSKLPVLRLSSKKRSDKAEMKRNERSVRFS